MMRKTLTLAVLALAPLSAFADHDAGCGLGTQLWAGQQGLVAKVLAATTNASFGNQTFGMTSGTLGCSKDGVVTAANRLPMFASANLDQLSADMASGHGEALAALASLYGVDDADRVAFYRTTQQHYAAIFTSSGVTAAQVLAGVDATLRADGRLAHYV
ncbi:MAG TPA: DUF3015 domain-containing protein [Nevskiaceae bacterium]|nr:DUF3015 domain-containing protein [Nevskiaceae bacterium]